jgi:hypothetical protein
MTVLGRRLIRTDATGANMLGSTASICRPFRWQDTIQSWTSFCERWRQVEVDSRFSARISEIFNFRGLQGAFVVSLQHETLQVRFAAQLFYSALWFIEWQR